MEQAGTSSDRGVAPRPVHAHHITSFRRSGRTARKPEANSRNPAPSQVPTDARTAASARTTRSRPSRCSRVRRDRRRPAAGPLARHYRPVPKQQPARTIAPHRRSMRMRRQSRRQTTRWESNVSSGSAPWDDDRRRMPVCGRLKGMDGHASGTGTRDENFTSRNARLDWIDDTPACFLSTRSTNSAYASRSAATTCRM